MTLATPTPAAPQQVWKQLSRLMAAPGRTYVRLYNPRTQKYSDTARRSDTLPKRPAAVYIHAKNRTHIIGLDFDASRASHEQADLDLQTAAMWLSSCGGAIITDRSAGGRHLICPLAIGTTASCDEIETLVRLLAARLPTLDITPNTNPVTGCLSVPGSPDKRGGYRQLDGTLTEAIDAFTTRSAPDLLPQLSMLLGALQPPSPQHRPNTPAPDALSINDVLDGHGEHARLKSTYRRTTPLPRDVEAFARHGHINPDRSTWNRPHTTGDGTSRHEPRMSVVVNAFARGHSLDDLRARIAPGAEWHRGLGAAYQRYATRAEQALQRDWTKASTWYITNVINSSHARHKEHNYSPGGIHKGWRGPEKLRRWLANAVAWADAEYAGKRCRWTVIAVLQALAFYAHTAGEERAGVWLVGVGGRTLSIASGLLSEDAVWRVLAELRDRPGSPILRTRQAIGRDADVYALTMQNQVTNDPAGAQRVRIEPVHPAWSVLGPHLRRLYELVAHHGLTSKADLYAAAALPRATGDRMITDLEIVGLLTRTGWGTVAPGHTSLDAIATQHHLHEQREERLERHRTERRTWHKWLDDLAQQRQPSIEAVDATPGSEHAAWIDDVMATGPPERDDIDDERESLDIIHTILGGRILTTNTQLAL